MDALEFVAFHDFHEQSENLKDYLLNRIKQAKEEAIADCVPLFERCDEFVEAVEGFLILLDEYPEILQQFPILLEPLSAVRSLNDELQADREEL